MTNLVSKVIEENIDDVYGLMKHFAVISGNILQEAQSLVTDLDDGVYGELRNETHIIPYKKNPITDCPKVLTDLLQNSFLLELSNISGVDSSRVNQHVLNDYGSYMAGNHAFITKFTMTDSDGTVSHLVSYLQGEQRLVSSSPQGSEDYTVSLTYHVTDMMDDLKALLQVGIDYYALVSSDVVKREELDLLKNISTKEFNDKFGQADWDDASPAYLSAKIHKKISQTKQSQETIQQSMLKIHTSYMDQIQKLSDRILDLIHTGPNFDYGGK